jgi:hypothetical protein
VDTTRRLPRATLTIATIAVAVLLSSAAVTPRLLEPPQASPPPVQAVAGGAAADGPRILSASPADGARLDGWASTLLEHDPRTGTATRAATGAPASDAVPPAAAPVRPAVRTSTSPEGYEIVEGTSQAGWGPTVTFTVEVEPATGIDPAEALDAAEDALFDPRSWSRDATLVRTSDPDQADIRLLFATPSTVDALCGAEGLETYGYYSCWTGRFATINSWRYAFGATGFEDLADYRRYVINHEVGHGLGHGHVGCPGPGQLAPVMMQQSATLGACAANGWPYPDA